MKHVTYINAGAGSGKTFTLTNILAARLNGKRYGKELQQDAIDPVSPTEVILTSFTEWAATEFREKARQEILKSGNFDAAAQMDSAAIGTVHSVALRFIKKFWYLLDYGADIQTITERDEDFYLSQSLARIVADPQYKQHFKNFRLFRDHYNVSDGYGHPDYLFWQRILNDVVEKMEYYDVANVQVSIAKSIDTLKDVYKGPAIDYPYIAQAVQEYGQFCKSQIKKDGDKADRCYQEAMRLLRIQKNDKQWRDAVSKLFSSLCKEATATVVCTKLTPCINLLSEADISASELDILIPFVTSIFTVAEAWRKDYEAYKQAKHIISYNDMERLFLLLLGKEEVVDYIKNHYRLVMVDEFQDSNPIQLKIFNRLSEIVGEGGGHSYWVGDPKQAIYGFRGSDTELVRSVTGHFAFFDDDNIHPEAGSHGLGSGRLVESWRSRAKLVYLVNETFDKPFQSDGIDPLLTTLTPHFTVNNPRQGDALIHWNCSANNEAELTATIATKVKEMIDSKPMVHHGKLDEPVEEITYKDIAILCRENARCSDLVKALRKLGVPVSETEDAIMQRVEVQLVVTLLQFIQNPTSKHTIAALKRLLLGETTEEILSERINYLQSLNGSNDVWEETDAYIMQLTEAVKRYANMGIPDMVRAVIHECNIPALCAKWGDEATRQQNLATLQQLADDYDQMCLRMGLGTSINGFVYFLNTVEPDREKDNQSNTVKVFTYHASKGLEWPVVVLNGLGKNTMDDADFTKKQFMQVRKVVLEDRSSIDNPFDKDYYLHYFPNVVKPGAKSKPSQALQNSICALPFYQELKKSTEGEERRLLYVGMTRAKDYLCSIGYKSKYNWLEVAGVENPADANVWGKGEFAPQCEQLGVPTIEEDDTLQQYQMVDKPTAHTAREPRYLSPSRLAAFAGYSGHTPWPHQGIAIPHRGWGQDYATIGSCIHDIFAIYRPGAMQANKTMALQVVANYGLPNLAGDVDAILRSADWLYEALQARYPRREGDGVEKECPFMMSLPNGQTLRGEMDLLWHYTDDDGQHCVLVDYKTFPGVALDGHTAGYYPQLSAYATALKESGIHLTAALVYYPIHGVIHELK